MTTPPEPLDDAEIVRAMRAHDARGLEALLAQHGERVVGVLRGRFDAKVPDSMLQEAMHDTALELMWHPHRLDDVQNLAGLLFVATRNEVLRRIEAERAQRHEPLPPDATTQIAAPSPAEEGSSRLAARVRAALAELSALERDVLDLDIASDFKAKGREIAAILGTSEQVVFATRNRIKGKLRKFVSEPAADRSRA